MPSESKPLLMTQTEKPNHYSYLKEFRVDQCPLFLQHKCTQHRPYTCFHWHFMNQRRRRPVRKRDGSFNYCADTYCTKFDETTGICPDGDDCPFLHRTAGDTERRYHLRYYKTCVCVHDTDTRGFCVKNGPHCAFAHGSHDLRPPVYDVKEIIALENPDADANAALNGPNVLDKERNLMNEDPKWQDSAYVLANYKTEPCKRPPRLCRQGYACPQYHNTRDKRRNPKKSKYRSTPCPNVKHGDEWGEPSNCESGDACQYCHTRTEQQFHPEIYKSTKCNDVQQAGYCPRGAFCAFAHIDQEMSVHRDTETTSGTNLVDILSNVLPPDSTRKDDQKSDSSNGSGEVSESGSICSVGSNNSSKAKAPGAEKSNANKNNNSLSNQLQNNHQELFTNNLLTSQQILGLENSLLAHLEKTPKNSFFNNGILDPFESMLGSVVDGIDDGLSLIDRDIDSPAISNTLTGLLGSSAPVNIPTSTLVDRNSLSNFSPPVSSPLNHIGYLGGTSRFHDVTSNGQSQHLDSKLGGFQNAGIYDFGQKTSPHHNPYHPLLNNLSSSPGPLTSEAQRSNAEFLNLKQCILLLTQENTQQRALIETLRRNGEERDRTISITEQQRDEALSQAQSLQKDLESLQKSPFLHGLRRISELKTLPIATLKTLQSQLRSDSEIIDKVIYQQTATLCMVCEEHVRSVTLECNHFVVCNHCVSTQKECPYCQTPLTETI